MAAKPTPRGRLPQRRLLLLVAVAAGVAAMVVGLAALATGGEDAATTTTAVPATTQPLPGRPSIALPPAAAAPAEAKARLEWALREQAKNPGPQADLRLAAAQVVAGDDAAARATLRASTGPEAEAALALINYTAQSSSATVAALKALVARAPDSPFIGFSYGAALLWAGQRGAGEQVLRGVRNAAPESFYGTAADNLVHPSAPPGYPPFVSTQPVPAASLAQLQATAVAHPDDTQAQIDAATALLTAGRRADAAEAFDAAIAVAPASVEARVGKIIATYTKDEPARSFGQLGPLVRDFPADPSPRLHLALMLIWIRDLDTARAEFRQVATADPNGRLGEIARQFLASL